MCFLHAYFFSKVVLRALYKIRFLFISLVQLERARRSQKMAVFWVVLTAIVLLLAFAYYYYSTFGVQLWCLVKQSSFPAHNFFETVQSILLSCTSFSALYSRKVRRLCSGLNYPIGGPNYPNLYSNVFVHLQKAN